MKNSKILFILVSTLFLSGCFNADEEKMKIKKTVAPFYESLLFEEINDTMLFFNENSKSYFDIYHSFLASFNDYDLLYKAEGISFDSVTKDFIQVKIKVSITGVSKEKEKIAKQVIHILNFKMDAEGKWKIDSFSEIPIE
jgi:hypothetical protein